MMERTATPRVGSSSPSPRTVAPSAAMHWRSRRPKVSLPGASGEDGCFGIPGAMALAGSSGNSLSYRVANAHCVVAAHPLRGAQKAFRSATAPESHSGHRSTCIARAETLQGDGTGHQVCTCIQSGAHTYEAPAPHGSCRSSLPLPARHSLLLGSFASSSAATERRKQTGTPPASASASSASTGRGS